MALDLTAELEGITGGLEAAGIPYALCGALALAVYGVTRATMDIDLLIEPDRLDEALAVARERGFDTPVEERTPEGEIRIQTTSKVDPESGQALPLDLVLVAPPLKEVWTGRRQIRWEAGLLHIVSRQGLILMKELRGDVQDEADIERLQEVHDD